MASNELERLVADARPQLSWRIGVSGHRKLPDAEMKLLNAAVERVFEESEAALLSLKNQPAAAQIFAPGACRMTLISPLAAGADRVCAEIAVKRKIPLAVPLPFAVEEYKKDFPQSVNDFDRLLEHARCGGGGVVVELEGKTAPKEDRDASYLAVGEFVLRHCDMLIAIWDGAPQRGKGGTGDIVERARRLGVPVIHIASAAPHDIRILEAGDVPSERPYSASALADLVARQILPKVRVPRPHDPSSGTKSEMHEISFRPAEIYFYKEPLKRTRTEPDFIYAGPFALAMPWYMRALAWIYPTFDALLGKKISVTKPEPSAPPAGGEESTVRYLFLHHHRADVLATFYANVHRSAFMLVYAFGALALIFAVLAIFTTPKGTHDPHEVSSLYVPSLFIILELGALFLVAGFVWIDYNFRWRDRWLEYRLLAELLREADLLAQIGRPMPFYKIDELAEDLPGRAWVMIAFRAIMRRADVVPAKYDAAYLTKVRDYAVNTRLQDQLAYHYRTKAKNESIARRLTFFGNLTVVLTVIVAVVKLESHEIAEAYRLAPLAAIFPALAYAAFGIRNQAEFEIVSKRCERMIAKLTRQKTRIAALAGECLTSEALGREILQAAAMMRHDAADWTSIFEVKETEAA